MKSVFVTGVDTGIGKTFVCLGLCLALRNKGIKTVYYKPFQSGAIEKDGTLYAPDICEIEKLDDSIETKYSYLLEGEVSPYLACELKNIKADINKIKSDYGELRKNNDFIVIEGAGGLFCPCAKGKLFCDIVNELEQEIIITTTPNLGRLNHTLMTIECAKSKNIKIKGLIINKMPEKPNLSEKNFIRELKDFCDIKILKVIKEMKTFDKKAILEAFKDIEI